jgi:hypothetical protein
VYICGLYGNGCVFDSQTLNIPNNYFNMFIAKYSSAGTLLWVKTGGGDYDDVGWSLAIDNAGKIYVGGEFNAYATFGNLSVTTSGSADVFVVCYDSSGNAQWVRDAGGSLIDRARAISCAGNNIYLTGQFGGTASFGSITKTAADSSDIFIAGMTNTGTFLWVTTVGGAADAVETLGYESGDAIYAEASGTVYATGAMLNGATFGNTTLNGYARTDMFLTKITSPAIPKDSIKSFVYNDPQIEKENKYSMIPVDPKPTGTENNENVIQEAFNVYPNPCYGNFIVKFPDQIAVKLELTIYNNIGQIIDIQQLESSSEMAVNMGNKEKGIYLVQLKVGQAMLRRKIILQ